jgi:hypothetical protein
MVGAEVKRLERRQRHPALGYEILGVHAGRWLSSQIGIVGLDLIEETAATNRPVLAVEGPGELE